MSTPAISTQPKVKARDRLAEAFAKAVEFHQANQLDRAETLYRLYLAQRPGHGQAWTNYGALLRKKGLFDAAIGVHRRALQADPDNRGARNNLANALTNVGAFEESLNIRLALFEQEPRSPARERDVCVSLRGLNRHDEVIERINKAEAEDRIDGECLLQRSLSRLMIGDYVGGFTDFEHRYAGDEVSLPDNAPWPRWQGESLDGKRILVLPEQGFGDAILASRFLPGLKAMGAEVHMQVKKPLRRLFQHLDGLDRMVDKARLKDGYDYYTPNMSLPHLVGLTDGQPPPRPNLDVPDDSRERARQLVAPFADRFRVGIIWTGSQTYKSNNRRSTTPESFLGLAQMPGVQLFSLYKGPAHDAFVQSGMSGLIVDACSKDRDFADSAAVMEQMDLMITTDTAVVHVGASLGRPVWNMLSHESFWLYGLGETTAWYPTMRLFRQRSQGDWTEVFERAEQALRNMLAAQSERAGRPGDPASA